LLILIKNKNIFSLKIVLLIRALDFKLQFGLRYYGTIPRKNSKHYLPSILKLLLLYARSTRGSFNPLNLLLISYYLLPIRIQIALIVVHCTAYKNPYIVISTTRDRYLYTYSEVIKLILFEWYIKRINTLFMNNETQTTCNCIKYTYRISR